MAKEEPTTTSTPNIIPMIQYEKGQIKLPPPQPHPIAAPTKANPLATHIIPFEEEEYEPGHQYPTRYNHQAQCL
eukprot:6367503-Ditylum_brightwellii.AAC.1